ncbi:hypothetical protein [uncultured Enterococcus sp.]|uniref:hypothetical protein n=1 Tax=uncultured Enterococcus sp. TaxID=167972 RepID=UPI002AA7AAFC|nr:hypothetical protein [uncultured Enterococcus sp.]
MKAYIVGVTSDPDSGEEIVFANTAKEARQKADCMDLTDYAESWIDIFAKRYPAFDDMENSSEDEIALKKFREGWNWFDRLNQPEEETTTDDEFFDWLVGSEAE